MMRVFWVFPVILLLITGCKKEDKDKDNLNASAPATALNGWSYHGKSAIIPNSADNSYQLFLAKVHEHGTTSKDVLYGVKYRMPNYVGAGNGLYINSARWLLNSDGSTLRHAEHSDLGEFTTPAHHLFKPVYKTSLGATHIAQWIFPLSVKVMGTGKGEFQVYNPGSVMSDAYFSNLSTSGGGSIPFHVCAGSSSPESVLSSPLCHIRSGNNLVQTGEGWNAINIALGTNLLTDQSFVLAYHSDSALIKLSAVTPQLLHTPEYGLVKKTQPLFAKRIHEIIPQWNKALQFEYIPSYLQYPSRPGILYFLVQNAQQLFMLSFNMNTFVIQLEAAYAQPRLDPVYLRDSHHFQWIDDDPGVFLYTGKAPQGVRAIVHKNGNTQTMQLPAFKSSVAPAVMDIRYDSGKFWMIVAENNKNLHLFSKTY